MTVVVVFESMFGNSHRVAAAIAEGLSPYGEVVLANVNDPASRAAAESADLLVVGGPTHVHGMSRPTTRLEAASWGHDASKKLSLEPLAPGTGVREWIATLERVPLLCAAFDTRVDIAHVLSGAASGHIERALTKRGAHAVVDAASFLVSKDTVLEDGELEKARAWGANVGEASGLVAVGH